MIEVTIDARELLAALEGFGHRAKDPREAMGKVTAFLIEQTRAAISSSGPGWPELADTTITHRAPGNSATSPLQGMIPLIVGTSTRDGSEVSIPGGYMPIHVTGRGKTPKRDPFEFFEKEETIQRIADLVAEHVAG